MLLTTLFGTAQLVLQDELRRMVDTSGVPPRAPNFILAWLRHTSFMAEFGWDPEGNLERFRRDLEGAMAEFVAAHGWAVGGSGTVVMNLELSGQSNECTVRAAFAASFYTLGITDDRGTRSVPVGANPALLGRLHGAHPRGFVPVTDGRKLLSREHLRLRFCDLRLYGQKLGRNLTTVNGVPMGPEELELHRGDVIACGGVRVAVESVLGADAVA